MIREELKTLQELIADYLKLQKCKPSQASAWRGAEDCNDVYQEYLEWSWENRDLLDTIKGHMQQFLEDW